MQMSTVRALVITATQLSVLAVGSESAARGPAKTHCVRTVRLSESCADAHSAIQDAVNHTRPGDTVLIAAGNYYEHLVINTDSIRLIGATDDQGEPLSVLHDVYSPEQITIRDAGSVEVANFVLVRKSSTVDGPFGFENSGSNTIHHVTVYKGADPTSAAADARSTAYGISGADEGANQFWNVIVWERKSKSRTAEEERRERLGDALKNVSERRQRPLPAN
jgi:hypothetical protein